MEARSPSPRELWRRLLPFLAAASLAFVLLPATTAVEPLEYLAALALTACVVGMTVLLPWQRVSSPAGVVPSFVFLAAAGLLRDSAGGMASGVGVLALLPVFWIALHGTRRELAAVLAGVAAYFLAPIVLIGGTGYPPSQYRSTVLFLMISGIIGVTVQRLVAQARAQTLELARRERDVERVATVARALPTSPDARVEVCRAACEISEARFAILVEPDGEGRLSSTAMAGLDAAPVSDAADRPSAMRQAFASGIGIYVADASADQRINQTLWGAHGSPASMLFEPVMQGETAVGLLVIAWQSAPRSSRARSLVGLLAAEAAVAIERADLLRRLGEMALTDPLTALSNRRALDAHLAQVLQAAGAARAGVYLAVFDLDHFKAYNDAHGHQSGDRLLKEAAAVWRAELRPGDLLARYGGEEFALVLAGCDDASALAVVERLRAAVPGQETCSVGIAQWNGRETADALMARADAALYEAKAAGRDRVAVTAF